MNKIFFILNSFTMPLAKPLDFYYEEHVIKKSTHLLYKHAKIPRICNLIGTIR